jgi:hypothetical protein
MLSLLLAILSVSAHAQSIGAGEQAPYVFNRTEDGKIDPMALDEDFAEVFNQIHQQKVMTSGLVVTGVVTAVSGVSPICSSGGVTPAISLCGSVPGSQISGDITGNAANVNGVVAITNGGTGATTAAGAMANLGAASAASVAASTAAIILSTGVLQTEINGKQNSFTGISSACAAGYYLSTGTWVNGVTTGGICTAVAAASVSTALSLSSASVSVLSYGAACDGATDDSAAFLSAFTAAQANNYTVQLPARTCLVSNVFAMNLTSGFVTIRGEGSASVIKAANNAEMSQMIATSGTNILNMYDFVLDGNRANLGTSSATPVSYGFVAASSHTRVNNVEFRNMEYMAVALFNVNGVPFDVSFDHCWFHDIGMTITGADNIGVGIFNCANNLSVTNSRFENIHATVSPIGDSTAMNVCGNGVSIIGNYFLNNYNVNGGQIAVSDFIDGSHDINAVIHGNILQQTGQFESDQTAGIEVDGSNVTVDGNTCLNTGRECIRLEGNSHGDVVSNNVMDGFGSENAGTYGINLIDTVTATSITGNVIRNGPGGIAVQNQGNGYGVQVWNNYIDTSVPSAYAGTQNMATLVAISSNNIAVGGATPVAAWTVYGQLNNQLASFSGNTAVNYPTVGTGIVFGENFTGGNEDMDIWDTLNNSVYPNTGFRFLQQTGASSYKELFDINGGSCTVPNQLTAASFVGVSGATETVSSSISGNGSVGNPLTVVSVPTSGVNLSTVTTQLNAVAVATTAIASGGATTYLLVSGANYMTGQFTTASTATIIGNAFSVGRASFTVAGGSATVAYSLTAGSFLGVTGATESISAALTGVGTAANPLGVNSSSVAVLSSGLVLDAQIDGSSITKQGNAFNGASQLVQMTGTGKLPAVDGSQLTNVVATSFNGGTVSGQTTFESTVTVQGNAFSVGGSTLVVKGGAVGLGTATPFPSFPLTVHGGTNSNLLFTTISSTFVAAGENDSYSAFAPLDLDGSVLALNGITSGKVGVGTTSPTSALSVQGVITSSTPIPSVSCTAGTGVMTAGSGTSFGSFVAGTAATGCTVTFVTAFPNARVFCQCQATSSVLVYASAASATSITCTSLSALTGDTITYFCQGQP